MIVIPLGGKLVGKSHSRLRPLLCDISNKSCHSQRPEKEIFDVFVQNACLNNGGFSPVMAWSLGVSTKSLKSFRRHLSMVSSFAAFC